MAMSKRLRRMMVEWTWSGASMIILHGLLFAAWIWLDPGSTRQFMPIVLLLAIYLAAGAALIGVFVWRVDRAYWPLVYREAQRSGINTRATVLNVQRTRWRIERNRALTLRARPQRYEYLLTLRVYPTDGTPYEGSTAIFLKHDQVPQRGDEIVVHVHPAHPEVIVWLTGVH